MNTGFSVTVFRDVAGNLTVAFRGTDRLAIGAQSDLPSGADIVGSGAAYDQIVAMVNWWARASAPAGQIVQQFKLVSHAPELVPADAVVLRPDGARVLVLESAPLANAFADERNVNAALVADSDGRVDLAGHSLGGHLSLVFSSLFSGVTGQVTVFNTPGFIDSPENRAFFQKLGGSIPTATVGSDIINVAADEALVNENPFKWIAGMHSRPGTTIDIAIEKQFNSDEPVPFAARDHSIAALTDSLAVYKLLADLDPNLSPADYKSFLNQASMFTAASLERIVDTLRTLFGIDGPLLEKGNGGGAREALYAAIADLRDPARSEYASKLGLLTITPTPDNAMALVSGAASAGVDGLAYRYALSALAPILVSGDEAQSLYVRHNANGELDLYDAANRTGTLTPHWLEDRAAFLERKLYITALNRNRFYEDPVTSDPNSFPNAPDARGQAYQTEAKHFEDRASGFVATDGSPSRDSQLHYVFGSDRADSINGASREDHLYGGSGADILTGGAGDDYLEGGSGRDVYAYASSTGLLGPSNDGNDTILDTDGQGVLLYTFTPSGTPQRAAMGGAGFMHSASQWQSANGKFTYAQQGEDLVITINGDAGGSLRLRDWSDGDFGIRLIANLASPPNPVRTFFGDKQDFDSDLTQAGIQAQADGLGNSVRADGQDSRPDIAEPDRADLFFGSAGADVEHFTTGGGDDQVNADGPDSATSTAGGQDLIETGAGRDIVNAGAGDDWIEGGSGADILSGNSGDDLIYAAVSGGDLLADITAAIAAGAGAGSGLEGDWLAGGAGDDILIGGADNDVLTGGEGVDLLIGGAGADSLLGDSTYVATALGWSFTDSAGQRVFTPVLGEASAVDGAADEIYGGPGDDFIRGGRGDDVIYGEGDMDDIAGEQGADVIFGGDGNDNLSGDASYIAGADHGTDYIDGGVGNDTITGDGGDDVIFGGTGNDAILGDAGFLDAVFHGADFIDGEDGNDTIGGGGGDDVLIGGEGADVLVGDAGNDLLDGGAGADILNGGEGDDCYLVDATDTIEDDSGANTIALAAGDGPESWELRELIVDNQPQVVLVLAGQTPETGGPPGLTINGRFEGFSFEFANGEALAAGEFIYRTATEGRGFVGGDGDDVLIGTRFEDRLDGKGGNDVLDGREGNDQLLGGDGDDVYVLDPGFGVDRIEEFTDFGFDTVRFGSGLSAADVTVARRANGDLVLSLSPQDQVMIIGQYRDGSKIESIEFGDGTTLTLAGIDALPISPIVGTNDPDTLPGTEANDTIEGLAGLDAYSLGYGLGQDTLIDTGGRIVLQTGLDFDALRAFRQGDDLAVLIRGTTEGAVLKDYFVTPQSWTVEDAGGAQTTAQAIADATSAREQDWLSAQRDDYRYSVKADIIGRHLFPGADVELVGDGLLHRPWQRSPGALQVSGFGSWTTSDITTTIHSANAPVTVLPSHTSDSTWFTSNILLSEFNIAITNETLESDEKLIFGGSARIEHPTVIQPVVATVIWDKRTVDQQTDNSTITTTGLLPGGGYVTSTARYSSFSGGVEGRAVDFVPVGTVSASSGLFPERVNATYTISNVTWIIGDIIAGPGDNEISNGDIIDAGAGDDVILDGGFAYGGTGNDVIFTSVAAGGPGDDFIGRANRILVLPGDAGHDTIHNIDGIDEYQLAEWYYPSIGSPDWEDCLFDPDTEDTVSIEEGIELGLLPALPKIAPHDYAALQPLYDAGVIQKDALEIGPGITFNDLALAWETTRLVSPLGDEFGIYAVLNVGITPDNVVSLVIPRSDDLLGAGLEEVRFADGTVVSMGELIAAAPPAPDFDPAFVPVGGPVFLFEAGDGVQFIDDPGVTAIEFGAGITAGMLTLGVGSLLIRVGDQGDEIHVVHFNPNDAFTNRIQSLVFADGTQLAYGELIARGFDIFGTGNDDFLNGTNATDRLRGGDGDDFYFFYPANGHDTIEDVAGIFDTVYLSAHATPDDITVTRAGDFLTLELSPTDRIAIRWQPAAGYQIEQVLFNGGATLDAATLESMATPQISVPVLAHPIADQAAPEDAAFSFTLPADVFTDDGDGDTLTFDATHADGGPLPAWLSFDAAAQHFGGTPGNDDVGRFDVTVTATDSGGLSASDSFTLTVENVNDAPILLSPLSNQISNQNAPLAFSIPAGSFDDIDAGEVLTFAAALADGHALPAWLDFDPTNHTFSGTPGEGDAGLHLISVVATDSAGAAVTGVFELSISDAATAFATYEGTKRGDLIHTSFENDFIDAGKGDDWISSGAGRDLVLAGKDDDRVYGGYGNDYLLGGKGNDDLFGEAGSDVLFGEHGDDHLDGGEGNDLLDGGKGKDHIIAGSGNNLIIGGPGSDILYGGSAHDVFLINRGDGKATLILEGAATAGDTDTISLGHGIAPDDIVLRRKNNDLIVSVAESDDDAAIKIVLDGWYEASSDHRTITRLQLIDHSVKIYDFTALAARYDAATGGRDRQWRAGEAMGEMLLATSHTEAIGGALAYQYAMQGTLAGVSTAAIQETLADPLFGESAQWILDHNGPTLAAFLTGDEGQDGGAEDFFALFGDSGVIDGPVPFVPGGTEEVPSLPLSAREDQNNSDDSGDDELLESLIERWFGADHNGSRSLGKFLEEEHAWGSERRETGRGAHHLTQDEVAAFWRRTQRLLESHLANQDPAALAGGEDHGFSAGLGGGGYSQTVLSGDRLSRVSGHHLRRLEGLDEGLTRL